ncbi:hypothetical protein BACT_1202 [Bifidobacterium actinocoloniiforme DSM 22766]|uniref:Uncharacterized protein n=1 Tax=Bifidobacterium actinocoloniiforme DSM 22766 TaxID=1437605 RepID=A0A086Z1U8_9BIFI|nr:hypothetical protein [Bifidobacterium actinocoloniiforme]AKV55601.1 hypothetical protein AB656_04630 [Bifidobacterium actinocoloniiforme DSM 22766]KFI40498.1 hypothetical protein BACT_1202 [Bifidobacterium actinocoloniiforme DSM 22766]
MPENKPEVKPQSQTAAVRRRRLSVVIGAAVIVILVLFSAFVWPHWAPRSSTAVPAASSSTGGDVAPSQTQPTIKAQPLPQGASDLLKAMPDSVGAFARLNAQAAADWQSASPLEEYQLTYSTGAAAKDVTLRVAQWSQEEDASKQYEALAAAQHGKELASGKVKVSGKATGSYSEHEVDGDAKRAVVVWRNATAIFQAEGPKASVDAFYQAFPL